MRGKSDLRSGEPIVVRCSERLTPLSPRSPGRFFGSCMLKLLLAYSILNYDVEHLPAAPAYIWMGDTAFPPPKATLRIRRRKGTV
jgi:hypothetical protein